MWQCYCYEKFVYITLWSNVEHWIDIKYVNYVTIWKKGCQAIQFSLKKHPKSSLTFCQITWHTQTLSLLYANRWTKCNDNIENVFPYFIKHDISLITLEINNIIIDCWAIEHDKFSVEEYGMCQQTKGFRSAAKDLLQAQDCAQRAQTGSDQRPWI